MNQDTESRIQIHIEIKPWIWICIKAYADPKHWFSTFMSNLNICIWILIQQLNECGSAILIQTGTSVDDPDLPRSKTFVRSGSGFEITWQVGSGSVMNWLVRSRYEIICYGSRSVKDQLPIAFDNKTEESETIYDYF